MKKVTLLLSLFFFLSLTYLHAQTIDWRNYADQPGNFFEIQEAFEQELGNQPYERGKGIKQFRRWEYYWSNRVDERGNFPEPGHVLDEMNRWYQTHPDGRNYTAGSGNWTLLGPVQKPANGTGQPNGNGRLLCISFHPTDANTLYVGAASGGFFKSTDNGSTWTEFSAGLTRLGVSSIVVHPSTPNTIYIGTGDRDGGDAPGYGVWRSTDGGLSWAAHNTGMGNRTVYEILMHPSNPLIMVAATSNGRIYRTTDGGSNWTFTTTGTTCKDIAFHPTNPNIVYAAGSRFYRSTDNGQSFSEVSSGLPTPVSRIALGVSVNQPNWVYVFAGGATGSGSFEGLYRSTDGGVNFSTRSTTPNIMGYSNTGADNNDQAWYDMCLAADPADANIIYAGSINIWKSTDGGSTWSISAHWTGSGADDVHADQHVMEFSPLSGTLYNGNDGGIYYTTDGGTVWTEISSGLYIAQIYKIGTSQQTKDLIINGYQDNGTAISQGTAFTTEIGGDGMECIIDPTDDNFMYGALYYGDIRRSTNGGASFSGISGPITESGAWVTPYKLDPNDPNRMFAGFDNVWRSDDVKGAATWTQISSFTGTNNMRDIAIAPSNSDIVYASRDLNGERFFRSNNATTGAPTWTNLSGSLPVNSTPKDIEIDPTDPTHLFIAIGNDIYESTNSGSSWTNISGTLPNISLNTIVIDKDSPLEAMYVGMDVGVYYRDNTMADWVAYGTGLPNVEVTELVIHSAPTTCNSTLYAATYGQGLWSSDLKDPGNVAPTACFETPVTTVCMGEVVVFTDKSSYTPTSWTWTITPGTFNFVGGTNANSQNPQVEFTAAGTYNISLQADNGTGTDTEVKNSYITVSASTVATSFNDDFESYSLCATTNDCGTTVCNLTGSLWRNLTNGTEDNHDWRVDEGGTPSAGTGPSIDFNPGTGTGNYAYLEASNGCTGQTAILESECINLNGSYNFNFGYHMFGTAMGEIHVDIFASGVWTNDIMTPLTANTGDVWNTQVIDLSAYSGQSVKLRIRGITGGGFESDIAIDDISFSLIAPLPIDLTEFTAKCNENGSNTLEWHLADNNFNGSFHIEKFNPSDNSWMALGTVVHDGSLSYEFIDNLPYYGENLYRLAMAEIGENVVFSNMATANCGNRIHSNAIAVFPNPFKDQVTIQFNANFMGKLPFKLTNPLGQILQAGNFNVINGLNTHQLAINDLPQGVYLLHLEGKMIKLVKN